MGELVDFPVKKKEPAFSVDVGDYVSVLPVQDIRDLASGAVSIAEYGEPEKLAQTLALIILDYMNESN